MCAYISEMEKCGKAFLTPEINIIVINGLQHRHHTKSAAMIYIIMEILQLGSAIQAGDLTSPQKANLPASE